MNTKPRRDLSIRTFLLGSFPCAIGRFDKYQKSISYYDRKCMSSFHVRHVVRVHVYIILKNPKYPFACIIGPSHKSSSHTYRKGLIFLFFYFFKWLIFFIGIESHKVDRNGFHFRIGRWVVDCSK
jgi:hypothetical protein